MLVMQRMLHRPRAMLSRMLRPRVMLGADSLRKGASGIGRVARLMARVLGEEVSAGRLEAEAIALSDDGAADDLGIPVRTLRGSRPRFVYEMHRAALRYSHFIYDFTGIARAHPRVAPLRRPYLTWIHGIEIWEGARADRLRRAQRADVLLANTEYTRARANALHPGLGHARVCWLATEENVAPPMPSTPPEAPTVLILSRLDAGGGYKGHRELITAWPRVMHEVSGARLVIAGDGPGMPTIRSWVDGSPARAQIELTGFVKDAVLDQLWQRASLFAMPSRGEGFGIAYVEAMRHGLPVLGSVHDAAVEVNADGEAGLNVDLDSPDELPSLLKGILDDGDALRRLGTSAHARWQREFRYDAFRARFLPFLSQLLNQS
jgi:phosphatidylinositol alpha-1,6-mannosyltransferase